MSPAFRTRPGGHVYRNRIERRVEILAFRMQLLSPFLLALILGFFLVSPAPGSLHFSQSREQTHSPSCWGWGRGLWILTKLLGIAPLPLHTPRGSRVSSSPFGGVLLGTQSGFQAPMPCQLKIPLSRICLISWL